jgi:hypothetical protein
VSLSTVSDRCAAPHATVLSCHCSSAALLQHIALRRIRVHRVHNFMFTPLERNVWSKLAQARLHLREHNNCCVPFRRTFKMSSALDVICRFVNDAVRRFSTMPRASWLCSTRRSCPSPCSSSPTHCSPRSPRITSTRVQVQCLVLYACHVW